MTLALHAKARCDSLHAVLCPGQLEIRHRTKELVACRSDHNIVWTQIGAHLVGDETEQPIALGMTLGVVDLLEAVDFDEDEGEATLGATGPLDLTRDVGEAVPACRGPGELVGRSERESSPRFGAEARRHSPIIGRPGSVGGGESPVRGSNRAAGGRTRPIRFCMEREVVAAEHEVSLTGLAVTLIGNAVTLISQSITLISLVQELG